MADQCPTKSTVKALIEAGLWILTRGQSNLYRYKPGPAMHTAGVWSYAELVN